jgi:NADH-quinone oxidoreductase subunit G
MAGRDTDTILTAAAAGELRALLVGGVEVDDLADPALARRALDTVDFLVSLEVRESAVTSLADVVLPVAPIAERSGAFVNWEGRVRPFERVLSSAALPDLRVLAEIAEELGRPLGFRTTDHARTEMIELGPWDGERLPFTRRPAEPVGEVPEGAAVLSTWRLLLDDSRGIDNEPHLQATARIPAAVISPATRDRLRLTEGSKVVLSAGATALAFPWVVGDVSDDVVWAPTNSDGVNLRRDAKLAAGSVVRVQAGARS